MVVLVSLDAYLSPLRYPGGKSKMVKTLASYIRQGRRTLIEACAGGASLGLSLLHAGLFDELWLNDLDLNVYTFWQVLTSEDGYVLLDKLKENPKPSVNDFLDAKLVLQAPYKKPRQSRIERAWAFLLVNRLAYRGNIHCGPMGGYDGSQEEMLSRWDPALLEKRLRFVYENRDRITVTKYHVCDLLWRIPRRTANSITVYLDPPRVSDDSPYEASMTLADHTELLNQVMDYQGKADFLVTVEEDEVGRMWAAYTGKESI